MERRQGDAVDLDLSGSREIIKPSPIAMDLRRSGFSASCPRTDATLQRPWRQLDGRQVSPEISGGLPRYRGQRCEVRTNRVPWAGCHARYTRVYEAFAIGSLQTATNVDKAAPPPGGRCPAANRSRRGKRAVATRCRTSPGLPQWSSTVQDVHRGNDYASAITDIDRARWTRGTR